jgi:hypothetical protein
VIGETAAGIYLTESGTKKKAIIRKALAGEGAPTSGYGRPATWRFPGRATPSDHCKRGRTKRPDDLRMTNRSRENERGRFFMNILLTEFHLVSRVFSIPLSFHAVS